MSAAPGLRTGSVRAAEFTLRPLDPFTDCELVLSWVTHPKSVFWMMQDARLQDIEREYMAVAAHPHQDAFIGSARGRPGYLMERYDPRHVCLAGLYDARPGDIGMHLLAAPTDTPVPGFTRAALASALRELFADPAVERVVVEPDIRNTRAHALFAHAGFEILGLIEKPEKDAYLGACTRESFERSASGAL
ncbi:GNAT family N-acetyltransferase [Streptomyces sp. CAU 1734]|uniref:GNAT family N-acetyltransferase n=1 Tax=Streptomyces sp. CAU 1734 TaxID=3140360 RepID=UPI003260EBAF